MIKEDKDLLVKDLCARLPYGVKCQYTCVVQEGTLVTGKSNWIGELKGIVPLSNGHIGFMVDCDKIDALEGDVKPLLRPMSSMTEEERKEYESSCILIPVNYDSDLSKYDYYTTDSIESFDWLNSHHFDVRHLIEKGLAIDCTGLNVY